MTIKENEKRIAEIRARLDAATEGHWYPISIEFRGQVSHSVKSAAGSVLAHTGYGPKGGSCNANAEFMAHARADVPFLLSELEAAQARLDAHRALHKPERRYIDASGQGETSFEFAKDAAEFYETAVGAVTFFEVCAHCGSIEQGDDGGRDYRESLWPCTDARALGLGEGADDAM